MTKHCITCGTTITGAVQKKFCGPCRKRRYRASTRYLNPGERIPEGEPGRYPAVHGYVRLRWKIAPYQYVETYEHRVRDGRVVNEQHVHHLNRDRGDNRPENLVPITADKHRLEHLPLWCEEATRLYREGLSTYKIAKIVGRDASVVYRSLIRKGVTMRTEARVAIPHREANR